MTSKVINSKVRLLIKYLSDSLISKLTDVFGEAKSLNVTLIPGSATLMKIVSLIRMSLQIRFPITSMPNRQNFSVMLFVFLVQPENRIATDNSPCLFILTYLLVCVSFE